MLFKLTHKSLIAFLSIFILYIFLSCYSVQQKNFVIDRSGILDSSQRQKLNNLYVHHEKITTNQIMLLTTDNFLPDSTIEKFSLHQFNEMGIGRRDVNNGVLIVFCAPMRKVRIATGFGTEKVLTANIAKNIIANKERTICHRSSSRWSTKVISSLSGLNFFKMLVAMKYLNTCFYKMPQR